MTSRFRCIYEDNPGGKYLRNAGEGRYHVLEWTDMDDACGRDNAGQPRYLVELAEIDLLEIGPAAIQEAQEFCGWADMPDTDEARVECLYDYGRKAPLDNWAGNNLGTLLRQARVRSREIEDPTVREEALNRTVNKIGSTAREFMQGDVNTAIERGVRRNDPNARLHAKLCGVPEDAIEKAAQEGPRSGPVAVSFNLKSLDSHDPLAYAAGFTQGVAGHSLDGGEKRSDLADEYVRGYRDGVDARTKK